MGEVNGTLEKRNALEEKRQDISAPDGANSDGDAPSHEKAVSIDTYIAATAVAIIAPKKALTLEQYKAGIDAAFESLSQRTDLFPPFTRKFISTKGGAFLNHATHLLYDFAASKDIKIAISTLAESSCFINYPKPENDEEWLTCGYYFLVCIAQKLSDLIGVTFDEEIINDIRALRVERSLNIRWEKPLLPLSEKDVKAFVENRKEASPPADMTPPGVVLADLEATEGIQGKVAEAVAGQTTETAVVSVPQTGSAGVEKKITPPRRVSRTTLVGVGVGAALGVLSTVAILDKAGKPNTHSTIPTSVQITSSTFDAGIIQNESSEAGIGKANIDIDDAGVDSNAGQDKILNNKNEEIVKTKNDDPTNKEVIAIKPKLNLKKQPKSQPAPPKQSSPPPRDLGY